jgi:subtilisin family serine protease
VPVRPDTLGLPLTIAFPSLASLYPKVIGAPAAWNSGYTGEGVGIAVLDSGVQSIADFGSRLVQVQLPGQTTNADTYGHGTFVAGIAAGSAPAGNYVGIAPGATVYAMNVARVDGSVYSSDVISGLDWVLANHTAYNIRVVNLSLSESAQSSYLASALDTAVERVWRDGVVVVASAGNRGPGRSATRRPTTRLRSRSARPTRRTRFRSRTTRLPRSPRAARRRTGSRSPTSSRPAGSSLRPSPGGRCSQASRL